MPFSRARRRASGAVLQIEDTALGDDGVEELDAQLGIPQRIGLEVETPGGEGGLARHPQLARGEQPLGKTLHQPGQDAAHRDGVEAVRVGVMVQALGAALVEDAAERSHGLVGLVVLLELVPHFLAHGGAGLAAGMLLLGLNGLLIELAEVVIEDEFLVDLFPLGLLEVDGGVVERQEASADGGVVDAEGAAGVELRVVAVLDGGLEILGAQLLLVLVLEPLVGDAAVPEVLVGEGPAVDHGGDPVLLQHLAAQAAAAGPGVDVGELAAGHRDGADGAEVGGRRSGPHRQHTRVGRVGAAALRDGVIHQGVDAAPAAFPDAREIQRDELHVDLFAVRPVEIEQGRRRCSANDPSTGRSP